LPIPNRKSAFTLIEMLTTVAALVIVLGLMVSLARYERRRSAENFTRDILGRLDELIATAQAPADRPLHDDLARVRPLVRSSGREPEELVLQLNAQRNNEDFVTAFKRHHGDQAAFPKIPLTLYNPRKNTLVDAWGTPIVYMPSGALNVGITPQYRSFFLSAGPDRRFSSVHDNLYSYERTGWETPTPAGQRE
jgi:type II secretory pathway pseudopilin PulG